MMTTAKTGIDSDLLFSSVESVCTRWILIGHLLSNKKKCDKFDFRPVLFLMNHVKRIYHLHVCLSLDVLLSALASNSHSSQHS